MSEMSEKSLSREAPPEPVWDIARLHPAQGQWSEEEYLALNSNHLVEFSHGIVEVPPMPTTSHQMIVFLLGRLLSDFVMARELGTVLLAPLRVRLWPGKYREPDVVFMRSEHAGRSGEPYWDGADLVMEVGNDDDRRRDMDIKRREYAQAGIPEYWIVDPRQGRIVVLRLDGDRYVEHGVFERGQRASSHLLEGFEVDVTASLSGRP